MPHQSKTASSVAIASRYWDGKRAVAVTDDVAEEVPVALVYNGVSHAVMMATPQDLADFALGFSLSEGILAAPAELYGWVERAHANGIELELTVAAERFQSLKARRRSLTGRTGCGLCGVDSLDQAIRPLRRIENQTARVAPAAIARAMAALPAHQPLNQRVRAVHAAAWATMSGDIVLVREDVGRHNALDKLIGALARTKRAPGFLVMTSRCSYEIVQKSVAADIAIVVTVSAPTTLAIRLAIDANVTLIALARGDEHRAYAHSERIADAA